MEKDKLDIQILLEIALNQKISEVIESSLPSILQLYLRKLNCIAVAVFQEGNWTYVLPHALKNNEIWLNNLHTFSDKFLTDNHKPIYQEINQVNFYGFPLHQFGWLCLIRKADFSNEMFLELNKVVQQLGRELTQAKEEQRLKLLQQLFDKSFDAIQICEESGRMYYVNDVASKRLGIVQSKVNEYKVSDSEKLFQAKPEAWAEHVVDLLENGQRILESENINQDTGAVIHVEVTVSLITVNHKNFVIAISRDISKRKKAEEKLLISYKEKNNILESIGDAFFTIDKNWTVTYWNNQAVKLMGLAKEEIVGKNLWNVFADAIDSSFYRQYHHAMETGEIVRFEEKYLTQGKWFEMNVYPLETGLSIYFTDVTLRKEADERLIKANERFEKVTEATNDAIWDWDIENNTLYCSEGFKTLFGYDINKVTQPLKFWTDHIHPEDFEWVTKSLEDVIQNDGSILTVEYRYKREDGTYAFVINRGIAIRDVNGKANRMVGAMTDISDRKKHEEQLLTFNRKLESQKKELQRSNEELEQFAFITSHDLQEPLRMISSFMDQLERKYADKLDDKAKQYIHFAKDGAKRMKQIILDLLFYSRINRPNEQEELVNLNEIVSEFLLLRRKLVAEKKAIVHYHQLPIIVSYKAPVTQLFHCLLDNALKYSRVNVPPVVDIKVEDKGAYWQFAIKDNGIGIEERFYEKVFIIFQRLHNRKEYEGTGIGLSTAKRAVEFLGGKIWLDSIVGEGSTFHFTISKTTNYTS